jgi:hypothetical protein
MGREQAMKNTATRPQNDITELWSDDLMSALARVVSLVRNHAGARDCAAWSELWAHFEKTHAHAERIAEALKAIVEKPYIIEGQAERIEQGKAALAQWERSKQ